MVKLGRCFVGRLAVGELAVGRHDGHILGQESCRNCHCGIEQAARVIAQIEHQPLDVGVLLVDVFDLFDEVVDRAFLKLRQSNPGIARLHHLAAHRLGLDFFTRDGDREGPAFVFAENGQCNFGVRLAAHALDRFVERQAAHRGVVDFGDQVVGLQAGAERWRTFDWRNHLYQAVFLRNFDADPDKAPGRAFAELLERLLVKVLRMRVEPGDHAGDGIGDQFLFVDRFHVVALDHAEHGGELL